MTTLRASGKLNHYLIENLVARSGMASIFRATDKRTGFRSRDLAPRLRPTMNIAHNFEPEGQKLTPEA